MTDTRIDENSLSEHSEVQKYVDMAHIVAGLTMLLAVTYYWLDRISVEATLIAVIVPWLLVGVLLLVERYHFRTHIGGFEEDG